MTKKTALEPAALVILSRVLGLGLEDTSDGDDFSSDCVYFAPFSSTKEGARPAGSFGIFCVGAAAYIGVFSGDIEATNRCHQVAILTSNKCQEERN
jgi:hypothetical protein